jgi:hypothetical protein
MLGAIGWRIVLSRDARPNRSVRNNKSFTEGALYLPSSALRADWVKYGKGAFPCNSDSALRQVT